MTKHEKRSCDLAAWLHRNKANFPDGFSAADIARQSTWERARFWGIVRLKKPEERYVVQMDKASRSVMRRFLGLGDFEKVTVYQKRIGPRRIGWDMPDVVPPALDGTVQSVARVLFGLARQGSIRAIPGTRPKRYEFQRERLVFGRDSA